MSKMTIRLRLMLFISILVLAVSLIMGFTSVIIATNIVQLNTEEWIMNEAEIGAELVSAYLTNYFALLREMASLDGVKTMDREIQYEVLYPHIEAMDVDDIMILDLEGFAWHIKGGAIPNVSHREYAQKTLSGQNALSDIILPAEGAVGAAFPVLLYGVPIISEGRIVGGLLVRTNALRLSDVIKSIKARGENYSFIWDNTGTTWAHTLRESAVGEHVFEAAEANPALIPIVEVAKTVIANNHGYTLYNFNNNSMVSGYSRIRGYDLSLVITANMNSVMTEVYSLRNIIIAIVGLAVIIGVLAAMYISGFIAKRLKNVQVSVQHFSEGDFSVKMKIKAEDEIGAIVHCINLTSDNVGRLVQTIKERTTSLSNIVSDLNGEMLQTTNAVKQINNNMVNINGRMSNQSTSISETGDAMKQIIESIGRLSENIDNQGESVAQSSSAIEEMLANIQSVTQTLVKNGDNVESLAGASDAGRSGLQEVASDIKEISRESEGLLEINSVIKNIASQTNLLSMNAAIEAAHAGEAGKGFAVVADEIRKLAESSSEQSKIISGVLKKIKESIDKIIRSTDVVLNKFEAIDSGVKTVSQQENNIRASMEEQSVGSKQILEAVSRLNELTRQVKTNSAEMRDGSHQVMQESQALERTTAEITSAVNEMESGTAHINTAIDKVNETTVKNRENIDVLVKEVEKFKTA